MKYRIEWNENIPNVIFEDEPQPRSWLLAFFLEEARLDIQGFLDEIEKARRGVQVPAGFTTNSVDVEFFRDKAVIEELYPEDGEDAEPKNTELSLDEAERLLLDWKSMLEERKLQHT